MNLKFLVTLLVLFPGIAMGAVRNDNARVGVQRVSAAGARMPNVSKTKKTTKAKTQEVEAVDSGEEVVEEDELDVAFDEEFVDEVVEVAEEVSVETVEEEPIEEKKVAKEETAPAQPEKASGDCREAYRACMDEFCLLDESEGYRCACSSNIESSKPLIQEIQSIQEEADKLYTEGVERENLGAKARLVFGESEAAKKSSRVSGFNFADWLNSDSSDDEDSDDELGADYDIGDALYETAAEFCKAELAACGSKSEMEEMLYTRQITSDCKAFNLYLKDQKANALSNKRTAEAAVRQARLAMLGTTNKYNRGECLLAYRACVADKGGCGTNFENCLDADLLERRSNACEGVLDQCLAVREDVLKDWEAESESILANAAKYADKYRRQTCLAQIQVCLEDGCSTTTNSACLSDVNVAAGVCPIIDECNNMIPGLKTVVNDKLGYLRTQFCQKDIDACLRDKCGKNFTAPECVGKTPVEIVELCPQDMFPSCKNETQYDVIVSAAVLQMDYQMMQGCVNYFSEQLGRTCGTDMECLPADATVAALTKIPTKETEMIELRKQVIENSKAAVADFFEQFEKDKTVAACQDAEKPTGKANLGTSIFNTAKIIAEIGAENRAMRELEMKIAELSREQDLEDAEKNCLNTYKVEKPNKTEKNYSYISSVSFEPSLRNCHVCRTQQVCEVGGESKATSALKAASGGLAAGASAGTMISPGWGTAIGGVVGAVGMGIMGAMSGGEKEFCQSIPSCEDINM